MKGYGLEDCKVLIGNEIRRKVSWVEGKSMKPLSGKAIRLHFVMKDADLFSVQFE